MNSQDRAAFQALIQSLQEPPSDAAITQGFQPQAPVEPPIPQRKPGYLLEDVGSATDRGFDFGSIGRMLTQKQFNGAPQDMRSLDDVLNETIKLEGGFVNDPADRGGATKFGISWNNNRDKLRALGYNSPGDVRHLTVDDAKVIYKDKYFLNPGFDALPQEVQPLVFDYGVHSGPTTAIKKLQKIVGVEQDGRLGPATLNKVYAYVEKHSAEKLSQEILKERERHLKKIVEKDPSQKKFLKGWLNRINYLRETEPTKTEEI